MEKLEKSIIERWQKGDKEAFEKIVRLYMSEAFLTALGLVGNEEDARDLSQEAFIKIYEARKSFDPERPFYPWFYRILKNHCLNFLRRSSRKSERLYFKDGRDRGRFSSGNLSPAEELEQREREKILVTALGMLSFEHKEIIVLKNFLDLRYKEIADILQIPMGTVMSRLYYARKVLKEIISELEEKGLPEGSPLFANGNPAPGEVV